MANKNFLLATLAGIVFLVFLPSLRCGFVNYDDDKFVLQNSDIQSFDLTKIFTSHYEGGYQPISQLSFAIDYKIGGLKPWIYHLTNVVLHALNSVLVCLILVAFGLSTITSWLMALLWALHPMRVESVTWIAERKDVLFSFFIFIAILMYFKQRLILSWGNFVIACLAKHQAALMGLLLPLFDWYRGENIVKRIRVYLIFVGTGFLIMAITILKAQSGWNNIAMHSLFEKIMLCTHAYVLYVIKTFWPVSLSILYPYPATSTGALPWTVYLSVGIIIVLKIFLLKNVKQWRWLMFGLMFFGLALVLPMANILVGGIFMNDRYTYVASIGIYFIIGICLDKLKGAIKQLAISFVIATAFMLAFLSAERMNVWANGVTLWSDVINQYPYYSRAYDNRANAYLTVGEDDKAMRDMQQAIQLDPNFFGVYNNRAFLYNKQGKYDLALADWSKAIALNPNYAEAYYNRGLLHYHQGRMAEAKRDLNEAKKLGVNVPQDLLISVGIIN